VIALPKVSVADEDCKECGGTGFDDNNEVCLCVMVKIGE
jgi:hypothetical protein